MTQAHSKHFFARALLLAPALLLTGCCITLPKLPPANPCTTGTLPVDAPDKGCVICHGEAGCCEKDCCPKECTQECQSRQVLYQYPMHRYGWSEYQMRYGSAMPAFGPDLYLKVPRELKADAIFVE